MNLKTAIVMRKWQIPNITIEYVENYVTEGSRRAEEEGKGEGGKVGPHEGGSKFPEGEFRQMERKTDR